VRYATVEEYANGEPLMTQVLKPADANLIRFLATGFRTSEWDGFLDQIINTVIHMEHEGTVETAKEELTAMLRAYKRKPQHWAPFGHPHVQIRVSMPIFLARQFVKHQVGGVWSEVSRRYISDEPGVWFPAEWHTRPEDIKQGSGGPVDRQDYCRNIATNSTDSALETYQDLLGLGVAPEEARIVLPLNMMTTVVWTGSLLFWSRVNNLRVDDHAQLAAQELGKLIAAIVEPLYPTSWKELTT
jgi:thymidylate synthase (FAD)